MSAYTARVLEIEQSYLQAERVKATIDNLVARLADMNQQYVVMLEAQQLLVTVNDDNTRVVLDYVTGIINKTLAELFPHDSRRVFLEKKMYQDKYAHIIVRLTGTHGRSRDLKLQTGNGLGQVISWLFVVCMVEVRKGRKLILMDELLHGLHPRAKRIIAEIMKLFVEEGYQFVMVEYGMDDIGKVYLVENPDGVATVTPLGKEYHDEVFVFNRPPEDVDLSLHIEEGDVGDDG